MKQRLAIVFLVLLAIGIFTTYVVNKMKLGRRNIIAQLIAENSMINIMVAGSNQFNDHKFRFFTIVSLNPESNKIGFTFIPPAYVTDVYEDGNGVRIDTVHQKDFSKLQKALEKDLDLKIPFYSSIYSPDIVRLIDLIEGINLFIFEEEKLLHGFKAGNNYADGEKVILYINNVEGNSIYYKYDRIMDVIFTIHNNRESLKHLLRLPFITEAMKTVKTNMMPKEMVSLAEIFFKDTTIYWTLLPGKINENGLYISDEIAKKIYADNFFKRLIIDEEGEKNVKVKILNATKISGVARKFRNDLMKDGINVVEFGTYESGTIENTMVIDQKGDALLLEYVSGIIGTDNTAQVIDRTQLHDILVIIGNDLGKLVNDDE